MMKYKEIFIVLFFLVFCISDIDNQVSEFTLGGLFPLTGRLSSGGVEREAASRVAVMNINNDPTILPNTELKIISYDTRTSQAGGVNALLDAVEDNTIATVGAASSGVSQIIAITASVFEVAQISYSSTSAILSDTSDYPFFSRMVPGDDKQGQALAKLVNQFGWDEVGAISTADNYGVLGMQEFILASEQVEPPIEIITYQQFVSSNADITVEIRELKNSGAFIFVAFLLSTDAQLVLNEAAKEENNLIGDKYVWLCSDGCAQTSLIKDEDGETSPVLSQRARGIIGTIPKGGHGELFEEFLDQWETLDPNEFAGAGDRDINIFASHAYDCVYTLALALDNLLVTNPNNITAFTITETIKTLNFTGLTGNIQFDENGDRLPIYDIVNFVPGDDDDDDETDVIDLVPIGEFIGTISRLEVEEDPYDYSNSTISVTEEDDDNDDDNDDDSDDDNGEIIDLGITEINIDPVFFDGTTDVPSGKPAINYWSCHDGEEKTDESGINVTIESPDGNDPDNIPITYECDQFIDCDNMSDEHWSCSPSYKITFLIFGIITCLLIFHVFIYIAFTIIFGFIFVRRTVKGISPVFLIMMCIASIVGYASTFAWYGKPHTAACIFQPWLLSLSICFLISSLFSKAFRIWQIFKNPLKKTIISNQKLMILVVILMIPCVIILILWTAFSTPEAKMVEFDDDEDDKSGSHFVCTTGGLTGTPGGIVFFSIMTAYIFIVLLFGVLCSFHTRNVEGTYNESSLIGYCVYNLTFLSAVIIPVYFVLRDDNPLAGWIIRTIGILYGFTATLVIQFWPRMWRVIVKDRCQNKVPNMKESHDVYTATGTNTGGG